MAKKEIYRCAHCQDHFSARVADRKRGWARFCSKSCKAIRQTQRTGYAGPRSLHDDYHEAGLAASEEGWDAHKRY